MHRITAMWPEDEGSMVKFLDGLVAPHKPEDMAWLEVWGILADGKHHLLLGDMLASEPSYSYGVSHGGIMVNGGTSYVGLNKAIGQDLDKGCGQSCSTEEQEGDSGQGRDTFPAVMTFR